MSASSQEDGSLLAPNLPIPLPAPDPPAPYRPMGVFCLRLSVDLEVFLVGGTRPLYEGFPPLPPSVLMAWGEAPGSHVSCPLATAD